MELETLTVVLAVAGMVMMYGAVMNRNPLDVVQRALRGEPISGAAPISTAGQNVTAPPGAVPGGTLPGTPEADGDARTDPPGFDPNRDDVLPRLPGESTPMGQPISYQTRSPYITRWA